MGKLVTKSDVAKLLNVSVRTIDNLRAKGLPSYKVGEQVRFSMTEVLHWVGIDSADSETELESQEVGNE